MTVESRAANYKDGSAMWVCRCDCGNKVVHKGVTLRSGKVQSCGCFCIEMNTKHLRCFTPEYKSWQSMKDRCHNASSKDYPRYGARGIRVCDRWLNSFENFFADMGPRTKGQSIDRIDNNSGYEPSNCRWTNNTTQANNRRSTRFVTLNGETKSVSEWARIVGISFVAMSKRLKQSTDPLFVLAPRSR